MIRPRLRRNRSFTRIVGRLLVVLIALAAIFYGVMTLLLSLKLVSPGTVDRISGYRAAYDFLAELSAADVTAEVRLIAGLAGLVGLLLFGYLAWRELPRPQLVAHNIDISREGDRGSTHASPRALERAAEFAATTAHPAVSAAGGRLAGRHLRLSVHLDQPDEIDVALRRSQQAAREAISEHGLAVARLDVTLTGYDSSNRRELS